MSNIVNLEKWLCQNKHNNDLSKSIEIKSEGYNNMDVMETNHNVEVIRGLKECFYTDKEIYDELIDSLTDEEIKYYYKMATGEDIEV